MPYTTINNQEKLWNRILIDIWYKKISIMILNHRSAILVNIATVTDSIGKN